MPPYFLPPPLSPPSLTLVPSTPPLHQTATKLFSPLLLPQPVLKMVFMFKTSLPTLFLSTTPPVKSLVTPPTSTSIKLPSLGHQTPAKLSLPFLTKPISSSKQTNSTTPTPSKTSPTSYHRYSPTGNGKSLKLKKPNLKIFLNLSSKSPPNQLKTFSFLLTTKKSSIKPPKKLPFQINSSPQSQQPPLNPRPET